VTNNEDCNDWNASRNPETVWYFDNDRDGYGGDTFVQQCTQPTNYVLNTDDCNDSTSAAAPGVTEVCDSIDNDCDGSTDEANTPDCTTYYRDYDGDGYGDSRYSQCTCSASGTYDVTNDDDCYDFRSTANPAQSGYFTSNRGDGSYDYNCNGSQEKAYTTTGGDCRLVVDLTDACQVDIGYTGSSPSCGSSGAYYESWSSCSYSTSGWPWEWGCKGTTRSKQQACR